MGGRQTFAAALPLPEHCPTHYWVEAAHAEGLPLAAPRPRGAGAGAGAAEEEGGGATAGAPSFELPLLLAAAATAGGAAADPLPRLVRALAPAAHAPVLRVRDASAASPRRRGGGAAGGAWHAEGSGPPRGARRPAAPAVWPARLLAGRAPNELSWMAWCNSCAANLSEGCAERCAPGGPRSTSTAHAVDRLDPGGGLGALEPQLAPRWLLGRTRWYLGRTRWHLAPPDDAELVGRQLEALADLAGAGESEAEDGDGDEAEDGSEAEDGRQG